MGVLEVKVHLFAKAKELAGGRNCIVCSLEADDESISVQDFLERYVFRVEPSLAVLRGSAFLAINDEYVEFSDIISLKTVTNRYASTDDSEGSGAMASATSPQVVIDTRLVNGPVRYEQPPFVANGGGENAFLGRTRCEESESHGPLVLLRYEAKESMALKELDKLAREAADKYALAAVRIVHSLGDVPVGEASVFVQVVSVHRKESFEATAEIMDRLKKRVPIWKQEVWQDGATWKDGAIVQPSS